MDCSFPPALSDQQLLALIEGATDPAVVAHLEHCPQCRARTADLAASWQRLHHQLYRAACPSSLALGEYQLGLIHNDQAQAIQTHVADCPHCRHELRQLSDFLQPAPMPAPLPPQSTPHTPLTVLLGQLTERLTDFIGGLGGSPALAGVRGSESDELLYQAGEVQIVLAIQPDPGRRDRRSILGLLWAPEQPPGISAQLWQNDQLLITAPVDELGNFVFAGLVRGRYGLILRSAQTEIRIPDLSV